MGQILFSKNPTGTVSLGLFLVGIAAFVLSAVEPFFRPIAVGTVIGGAGVAVLLWRRRPRRLSIDPRQPSTPHQPPPPIEPR
jgi:hypothetical protein